VHFVGHSAGAQVVRVLHHMFTDKVHKQEIFRFYSQVIAVYCYWWNYSCLPCAFKGMVHVSWSIGLEHPN
jgi:hypothetical protein